MSSSSQSYDWATDEVDAIDPDEEQDDEPAFPEDDFDPEDEDA